ncbi:MAG: hypothetical protein AAGH60_10780 [Pseudomonadota bacterium]
MAPTLGPLRTHTGRALAAVAALLARLSYGPQKYLDPAIGEIWPAVMLGQLLALVLLVFAARPSLAARAA